MDTAAKERGGSSGDGGRGDGGGRQPRELRRELVEAVARQKLGAQPPVPSLMAIMPLPCWPPPRTAQPTKERHSHSSAMRWASSSAE